MEDKMGKVSCIGLIVALAFSVKTMPLAAQSESGQVRGVEIAAAVNLKKKDVKIEGTLFVPEKVSRVRAVIVAINWGIGGSVYQDPQFRKLIETLQSCLLLARVSNIGPTLANVPVADRVERNAAIGGAEALILLLQRLAEESGHQEVGDAPLVLWGHSAAGSFAMTFAALQPRRTIAFVRYHSHLRGLPVDMKTVAAIPALLFAGDKDETAGVEDTQQLWTVGRANSAPWTFALEPGATHASLESLKKANALTIPWIAAVFTQRVHAGQTALRSVIERPAWMGNHATGEISAVASLRGSVSESWLPDEPSARGWRMVSGTEK
jgi:dienelactone hydrolase